MGTNIASIQLSSQVSDIENALSLLLITPGLYGFQSALMGSYFEQEFPYVPTAAAYTRHH
jgi:hypothetical protein